MSAILKIKIPFFRRKTSGGSNGIGTFYLGETPKYLPALNQVCMITHTNISTVSGLANKLGQMSTNVVAGKFQSYEELASQDTIKITDNYKNFFVIEYLDHTFSINQFSGDCTGYIEYDVNPATLEILKPVENVAIVNENVPFDNDEGFTELWGTTGGLVSTPPQATDPILPGMMVRLKDNNTVFANMLKSLNLPVSDEDMKKYTRSDLGYLVENLTDGKIEIDGRKYDWIAATGTTSNVELMPHPITGHTGEYYNTVLQHIGSIDHPSGVGAKPIPNQVVAVFEIPQAFYGEVIDGKTIKLTLPYKTSGEPSTNGVYTYSGSDIGIDIYGTYNKNGTNLDLNLSDKDLSLATLGARPDLERSISEYESNVVLLFADEVKQPRGLFSKSWAGGHTELIDGVKVYTPSAINPKEPYDYNMDRCIGVAYLDKGFIVITHPKVVDSIFTNQFNTNVGAISVINGAKSYDFDSPATGNTKGLVETFDQTLIKTVNHLNEVEWDNTQWLFTTTATTPKLEFISYNSEKSLNVICLASADEFYRSTNTTAKELLGVDEGEDFASFKSEDANLYPVMITQIGIHDAQGNLLAVCKPTQPVKKYWFDVVSFAIKVRI